MDNPTGTVRFHFDPACPWTWMTSRWLADATAQRGVTVHWRAFSLALLNEGQEPPEQFRAIMELSRPALRVVEYLAAAGRHEEAGAFYAHLGTALHVEKLPPRRELLEAALVAAGAEDAAAAADDPALDDAVRLAHQHAFKLAGPDVGSPILVLEPEEYAAHGPIVSPAPHGEEAAQLFDAIVTLMRSDRFHELKRGRTSPPAVRGRAAA